MEHVLGKKGKNTRAKCLTSSKSEFIAKDITHITYDKRGHFQTDFVQ